jgi:hypothetical protein
MMLAGDALANGGVRSAPPPRCVDCGAAQRAGLWHPAAAAGAVDGAGSQHPCGGRSGHRGGRAQEADALSNTQRRGGAALLGVRRAHVDGGAIAAPQVRGRKAAVAVSSGGDHRGGSRASPNGAHVLLPAVLAALRVDGGNV